LEVGYGASLWLPYFIKQSGLDVAGIDYSDVGLALSREFRGFYRRLDMAAIRSYHRSLGLTILESSYVQFLDLSFLTLTFLPRRLRWPMALIFRGFGFILIAMERAISRPVQFPLLCAGMIVVAQPKD
jgi:hypothetical protein